MALLEIAALLSFATGSAAVQGVPATPSIQEAPDSASDRAQLRAFSMCLAQQRPTWARNALGHAYLGAEQASMTRTVQNGRDTCMTDSRADIMMRISTMIGSLAEHFIATEMSASDLPRVRRALTIANPLNSSEDFGLCIAARDAEAARSLAMSEPGSAAESAAIGRLARHVEACTNPGEQLTVDVQALRSLTAIALYRALRSQVASN